MFIVSLKKQDSGFHLSYIGQVQKQVVLCIKSGPSTWRKQYFWSNHTLVIHSINHSLREKILSTFLFAVNMQSVGKKHK